MTAFLSLEVSRFPDRPQAAAVTLRRPHVKNALDDAALRELAAAFRSLAGEKDLRAVVLRGEGPDFCAGADITWMRRAGELRGAAARRDAGLLVSACRAVDECPVPVIAAARGAVFGGGLGLLAASDISLASEDAKLCFSECRLGIMPAVISCWVAPRIGTANARRYYLTAEVFGAREAREMGLVHEAVAPDALDGRVQALLDAVLRNGPKAVREAKAFLRRFNATPPGRRPALAVETLLALRSGAEGQEGLRAFLEKRQPSWASAAP